MTRVNDNRLGEKSGPFLESLLSREATQCKTATRSAHGPGREAERFVSYNSSLLCSSSSVAASNSSASPPSSSSSCSLSSARCSSS